MAWIRYNPNPSNKQTGDCVVRAVAIAEGLTWDEAYKELTTKAFQEKDMPSVNPVWANYLESIGYEIHGIPNTCPRCYTVAQFAADHPHGTYVLGTGSHAIAVIDGNYIDTWDSGNEIPMYFFMKGDNQNELYGELPNTERSGDPVLTTDEPTVPAPVDGDVLGPGTGGSPKLPNKLGQL